MVARWTWRGRGRGCLLGSLVEVIGLVLATGASAAGPLLDLAESVLTPGDPVEVTVLGEPGHAYAVATSRTNAGLVVHGRALQLGPDAVVLATGRLDAQGRATVEITPDFAGDTVGKVHVQAVTAPTAGFEALALTPGKVLRNLVVAVRGLGLTLPDPGSGGAGGGAPEVPAARPLPSAALLAALLAPASGRDEPLGCVGCVTTAALADGAVTIAKLAPGVIGAAAWSLAGNAGTDPATQFLGTTDPQPVELRVGGRRAFRLEPEGAADPFFGASPNVVGGVGLNAVLPGVVGGTIAGGGSSADEFFCTAIPDTPCPNRVTAHFGTVGGGAGNQAGDGAGSLTDRSFATVGGGLANLASGERATIGGGAFHTASGRNATVGGGELNRAIGNEAAIGGGGGNTASGSNGSTVAGGLANTASSSEATVGGGGFNTASGFGATVGGGESNRASGNEATVGGGGNNTASGRGSTVPGGFGAVAALHGQLAYAAGRFSVDGDGQTSVYVLRRTTTDGTANQLLFLDGSFQRLTVPVGRALAFDAMVVGRSSEGFVGAYHLRGVVKNNGGTTGLVTAPTVEVLGEDVAIQAAWAADVVALNADDTLDFRVTGENGRTIRWVATVRAVEVAF